MAREKVDIFHQEGLIAGSRCSADSLSGRDVDTCRFTLKGADREHAVSHDIKAGPVQIFHRKHDQSRYIA